MSDHLLTPPDGKGRRAIRGNLGPLALIAAGAAIMVMAMVLPTGAGAVAVAPGETITVANTPYDFSDGACDPDRNGWHIILNGLTTSDGQPPTASDFGPVELTFAQGPGGSAAFTDVSSGSVAHFLDATTNQSPPATITEATMTFPAGSRVTGYNQFRISHPPCGTPVTTTTTVPDTTTTTSPVITTTTVPDTTTTVPDTTTTTSPVITTTTVPDTTTTTSPVTTTTTVPDTTTTVPDTTTTTSPVITTTVPDTTTTVPDTTTTSPVITTTTVPDTTTTSPVITTTTVPDTTTTTSPVITTTVPDTTTTEPVITTVPEGPTGGDSARPETVSPSGFTAIGASRAPGTLPATGTDGTLLTVLGMGAIAGGLGLWGISRRNRQS